MSEYEKPLPPEQEKPSARTGVPRNQAMTCYARLYSHAPRHESTRMPFLHKPRLTPQVPPLLTLPILAIVPILPSCQTIPRHFPNILR